MNENFFYKKDLLQKIKIYTDSSKAPHTNTTGIAFVIVSYNNRILIDKWQKQVNLKSNNRGELLAIVESIKYVMQNYSSLKQVVVHSDNRWAINCISKHWKARKHLDLFTELDLLLELVNFNVKFSWVSRENRFIKEADYLANQIRLRGENEVSRK